MQLFSVFMGLRGGHFGYFGFFGRAVGSAALWFLLLLLPYEEDFPLRVYPGDVEQIKWKKLIRVLHLHKRGIIQVGSVVSAREMRLSRLLI